MPPPGGNDATSHLRHGARVRRGLRALTEARKGYVQTHQAGYCRLLLIFYLASVALVCSFILFEVLDIDGSDFLPPSPLVEARPVTSHADDLKRAILAVALALMAAPVLSALIDRLTLRRATRRTTWLGICITPSLATRSLLPRASLGDGLAA